MSTGRIAAEADQLRAAWKAGRSHGRMGGSRSVDPFIHEADRTGDRDLHIAWDEGWIAGAAAGSRQTRF
jgi:hypothetical protein